MTAYSFWDDMPPEETQRVWRSCLGLSPACTKRVWGFKADRLCARCTGDNKSQAKRRHTHRSRQEKPTPK